MRPFAASPAVEGAFVFTPGQTAHKYGVFTVLPSPVAGGLQVGAGGLALGRFGFADADGIVTNARVSAADRIGIAIPPFTQPVLNTWQRNYWDAITQTLRARTGTEAVLLTRGSGVWVRFAGGAWPGQKVYASVLDGQAFSGYAVNAELTLWSVLTKADPGELAVISTSAFFGGL